MAHGWSTGVLPALTNELLGVTPTGPGFSTWTVEPHPGSVSWAQGQVPTPHGPLTVQWQQTADRFTLHVNAPKGTRGKAVIPVAGGTKQFELGAGARMISLGRAG
jgi:hypothetical protein